jgi:hypothetical protein
MVFLWFPYVFFRSFGGSVDQLLSVARPGCWYIGRSQRASLLGLGPRICEHRCCDTNPSGLMIRLSFNVERYIYLSVCLSVCLSIYLSICMYNYVYIYILYIIDNIRNIPSKYGDTSGYKWINDGWLIILGGYTILGVDIIHRGSAHDSAVDSNSNWPFLNGLGGATCSFFGYQRKIYPLVN